MPLRIRSRKRLKEKKRERKKRRTRLSARKTTKIVKHAHKRVYSEGRQKKKH